MQSDIQQLTDAQLVALDQLLTQTHRLYGLLDEFESHPLLDVEEQELVSKMFADANSLDNRVHDRLEAAKQRRSISEADSVKDHVESDLYGGSD